MSWNPTATHPSQTLTRPMPSPQASWKSPCTQNVTPPETQRRSLCTMKILVRRLRYGQVCLTLANQVPDFTKHKMTMFLQSAKQSDPLDPLIVCVSFITYISFIICYSNFQQATPKFQQHPPGAELCLLAGAQFSTAWYLWSTNQHPNIRCVNLFRVSISICIKKLPSICIKKLPSICIKKLPFQMGINSSVFHPKVIPSVHPSIKGFHFADVWSSAASISLAPRYNGRSYISVGEKIRQGRLMCSKKMEALFFCGCFPTFFLIEHLQLLKKIRKNSLRVRLDFWVCNGSTAYQRLWDYTN